MLPRWNLDCCRRNWSPNNGHSWAIPPDHHILVKFLSTLNLADPVGLLNEQNTGEVTHASPGSKIQEGLVTSASVLSGTLSHHVTNPATLLEIPCGEAWRGRSPKTMERGACCPSIGAEPSLPATFSKEQERTCTWSLLECFCPSIWWHMQEIMSKDRRKADQLSPRWPST